jgi:hypothetical protein
LHAYKIQIVQALKLNDHVVHYAFATDILERLNKDSGFLKRVVFLMRIPFMSQGVTHHNVRIWGSEKPNVVQEMECDRPKITAICRLKHDRVVGPFFFNEPTTNKTNYLQMLQNHVVAQLPNLDQVIFQQDGGAPPHWGREVRDYLNATFPSR